MTASLLIYDPDDDGKTVEAYHLATYLGYAQQHLLRKAVLTDWKKHFYPGIDYHVEHREAELRLYEATHLALGFGALRPMGPERGRMFFTVPGLRKILFHTSKDVTQLRRELEQADVQLEDAGIEPFTHAPAAVKKEPVPDGDPKDRHRRAEELRDLLVHGEVPDGGLTETSESFRQTPPEPRSSPYDDPGDRSRGEGIREAMRTRRELEQRKWEYSVLEQLLEHLRQLSNPVLQKLAITAAEVALGHELTELRAGLETARAHSAFAEMTTPPRSVLERGAPAGTREESQPEGLFPTIPGIFYSCSDIGARAGGFSARAAGMAANSVASRRGITPEELRAGRRFRVDALQGEVERLRGDTLQGEVEITGVQGNFDFVQVYTKMDAFGQPRKMFAFDAEFANEVIRELRAKFTPQRLDLGPDPNLDFGQRKSYPKLSRGPFEDDDELSPGP